jgi:flagellar biogenesis protein FliO
MKHMVSSAVAILAIFASSTAFAADDPNTANTAAQTAPAGSGAPWWSRRSKASGPPAASASAAPSTEAPLAAPSASSAAAHTQAAQAAPAASAAAVAPSPAASASAPAETATPLATRPSKPLNLASDSTNTPWTYKVGAGIAVAAAAALWMRNKRRQQKVKKKPARIDILARQSVAVRSELLVVEVEGTRLFLGLTPNAIQTLMVLDNDSAPVEASADAEEELVSMKSLTAPKQRKHIETEPESLLETLVDVRDRAVVNAPAPPARRPSSTNLPRPRLPSRRLNAVTTEQIETAQKSQELGDKVRSLLTPRTASQQLKAVDAALPKARQSSPKLIAAGQAKGLLLALEEEPEQKPMRLGDW